MFQLVATLCLAAWLPSLQYRSMQSVMLLVRSDTVAAVHNILELEVIHRVVVF